MSHIVSFVSGPALTVPLTPPLQAVLEGLHGCVTEAQPWHGLLRSFNALLKADAGYLVLHGPSRPPLRAAETTGQPVPPPDLDVYAALPRGAVRAGAPHLLVAVFAFEGTTGVIAAQRESAAAPFNREDAALLTALLPHLASCLGLRERFEAQRAAARRAGELFDALPAACIVTDSAGRCLQATAAFRTQTGHGGFHLATGRVRFDAPQLQQLWETALAEAYLTGLPQSLRLAVSATQGWQVHLKPWLPEEAPDGPDMRLILASFQEASAQALLDPAALAGAARLTQAELDVLSSLLKGLPAKAIAGQRGASVNTVRSQIMAILEKTGFRSQKELIASFGASSFEHSATSYAPSVRHRANA